MLLEYKKEHIQAIDSTQKELVRRFQNGTLQHGVVLSANSQSDGIGRYERKWVSDMGNLSLSLALDIPSHKTQQVAQLCFVTAVAMGEAISELIDLPLQYKWVNDFIVDGKKLGGILCQYYAPFAIVGVGINVITHPMLDDYATTSMADYGKVDAAELQEVFLQRFEGYYEAWLNDFEPIRRTWLKRGPEVGVTLKVRAGEELHIGQFEGIDTAGNLMLKQKDGVKILSYGETVLEKA